MKARDVIISPVISVKPTSSVREAGKIFLERRISAVPVVDNQGKLVGIVSRANLVQAAASARKALEIPLSDTTIRDQLPNHLKQQKWAHTSLLNVAVGGGVVDLWGIAQSEAERKAIRVAAESIQGAQAVNDNLVKRPIEASTRPSSLAESKWTAHNGDDATNNDVNCNAIAMTF